MFDPEEKLDPVTRWTIFAMVLFLGFVLWMGWMVYTANQSQLYTETVYYQ